MKNNNLKQKFIDNASLLESMGFISGKLLFMKETKFFNPTNLLEEQITIILDPNEKPAMNQGSVSVSKYAIAQNLVSTTSTTDRYVKVFKNEPLLFLGYESVKSNVVILNKNPKFSKEIIFQKINSKNHANFFEESCELNKNEFIKLIVEEMIDINFDYKVMLFLYQKKVIWWSIEHLNNGIEFLEKSFSFQKINEND